jgi:hypothetical protein
MNKSKQLTQKINFLENETDGLGMPIDSGILKTVALLNLLGFSTHQSCHGHLNVDNYGLPYAWVNFETPTEKEFNDEDDDPNAFKRHWYFEFLEEIGEVARIETRKKFNIPQNKEINFSNKEIEKYYDESRDKAIKEHWRYESYLEASNKIKEERKIVYQEIKALMSEFFNNSKISLDEFYIRQTLRIDFTSEKNCKNRKNLSLDEKFLIFKSSLEKLKLFEKFLLEKWNNS